MKALGWGTSLALYIIISLCGVYCLHAAIDWLMPSGPSRAQLLPPSHSIPVDYNHPDFTKE